MRFRPCPIKRQTADAMAKRKEHHGIWRNLECKVQNLNRPDISIWNIICELCRFILTGKDTVMKWFNLFYNTHGQQNNWLNRVFVLKVISEATWVTLCLSQGSWEVNTFWHHANDIAYPSNISGRLSHDIRWRVIHGLYDNSPKSGRTKKHEWLLFLDIFIRIPHTVV